jgi:hypothetical protein
MRSMTLGLFFLTQVWATDAYSRPADKPDLKPFETSVE